MSFVLSPAEDLRSLGEFRHHLLTLVLMGGVVQVFAVHKTFVPHDKNGTLSN